SPNLPHWCARPRATLCRSTKESPSMSSNDDHSSLPASKTFSRGIVLAVIVAAILFNGAPRFSAQTPSEAPAQQPAAQRTSPQQQSVPPARIIEMDDFA